MADEAEVKVEKSEDARDAGKEESKEVGESHKDKSKSEKDSKMAEDMSGLSAQLNNMGMMQAHSSGKVEGAAAKSGMPLGAAAIGAAVGFGAAWLGFDRRRGYGDGFGYGAPGVATTAVSDIFISDKINGTNTLILEQSTANQAGLNAINSNMQMGFCNTNHNIDNTRCAINSNIDNTRCEILGAVEAKGNQILGAMSAQTIAEQNNRILMLEMDKRHENVMVNVQQSVNSGLAPLYSGLNETRSAINQLALVNVGA